MSATTRTRTPGPRHYLMCRPTHFDVTYAINPWMDPAKPVDTGLAVAQWESLRDLYLSLGHTVEFIEPVPGLPDMVYAANGATVVDGKVLGARFRNAERAAEGPAYLDWFVTGASRCTTRRTSTRARATSSSPGGTSWPATASAAPATGTPRRRSSSAVRSSAWS
ncbi:hypothetical protein SRIMM317S_04733 [Streptomyces rimosus subsp. rimosus]